MWLLSVPVFLCSSLPASTVSVALWVSKCSQVTLGGIFPICLGQSMLPLRFIMKSLTNSLDAGQKATDA